MDLARKEDFQHSLPHRPEKWDKTRRVALVFVNALSIRGAWDGAAARPFMYQELRWLSKYIPYQKSST